MKTKAFFFGMAVVALSLASCQKINDALVVTVPMEFSNDLEVNAGGPELKSSMTIYPFIAATTFNPSTDATYKKYQDKIKSIAATGFTYTPKTLPVPVTVISAQLKIYTGTESAPTKMVSWNFSNVTLTNGVAVTLPAPSTGTLADVTAMLDGASDITISWSGTQNVMVIPYFLNLVIQSEIKAYLLK